MTPVGPSRFTISGITLEFSPPEGRQPRAWYLTDGQAQRLLELGSVEFDSSGVDLQPFAGEYAALEAIVFVPARDGGRRESTRSRNSSSRSG